VNDAPRQGDRYEPLPGLLSLPGFLLAKLGRRGRLVLAMSAVLALAALAAAAIVLVPQIADKKSEDAARERREAVAAAETRRLRLIAEQRPRRGRSDPGATTPGERRAVIETVEAGIVRDARSRVRAGTMTPPPARYANCERSRRARPSRGRLSLTCVAVTSDILRDGAKVGVVGHPFRARIDFRTGRYAWCKVSGRPGEGALTRTTGVRVPRACGG